MYTAYNTDVNDKPSHKDAARDHKEGFRTS